MQEQILELLEQMIELTAAQVSKVLLKQLKVIINSLTRLLETYQHDDPYITWTQLNQFNRMQNELDAIDELLQGAYSEVIEMIRESQANVELECYYRHMHMIDMSSDIDFLNNVVLYKQAKSAMSQEIHHIKLDKTFNNHRKATIDRIRGHLTTGVLEGKNYNNISNNISNDIGMSARQAKRVARTEVGRAQSESQLTAEQQAVELGARIMGYWDATLDLRTRSSHAHMDGKEVGKDGNFKVGSSVGPAPRLLIGPDSASQNINCRCKKLLKVNGMKPKMRSARNSQGRSIKVEYQTYDEWRKALDEEVKQAENMKFKEEQANARKEMNQMIENGTITLDINPEKQNRHTLGHPLYDNYKKSNIEKGKPIPSYFEVSFEELKKLYELEEDNIVLEVHTTKKHWTKKAVINLNKDIGVSFIEGKPVKTSYAKIHYSKTGTHMVPYVKKGS